MIVILDFGSQFCHLILKQLRYLQYSARIFPHDISVNELSSFNIDGIIFSGGPKSIFEEEAPHPDPRIYDLNVPILGICYGSNLIAEYYGGTVKRVGKAEYGIEMVDVLDRHHPLTEGLMEKEQVLMSHGDSIEALPPSAKILGRTKKVIAIFALDDRKAYGVQFHPEVHHTPNGKIILENFARICEAEKKKDMQDFITDQVWRIRNTVGPNEHVLMAVSGGIDSTVAAMIIEEAIGDRLHCVFVDNGLMRKNEVPQVRKNYEKFFTNFYVVDASEKFLSALRGVTDPQQKRRIIGKMFYEVFHEFKEKLSQQGINLRYLGQGTIYPDRIESAAPSKTASHIKQHHNLVPLPEYLKLELIEPLKDLFKFEVREIGRKLGLDDYFLQRHPFPGPGLAVRCLGEITRERLDALREADAIFEEIIRKYGIYEDAWQAFAVLLPVKTVGVQGDERTYREVIALRVVESKDAMTATVPSLPWQLLYEAARRIVDEIPLVNRVVLDVTSKPPATIEWE